MYNSVQPHSILGARHIHLNVLHIHPFHVQCCIRSIRYLFVIPQNNTKLLRKNWVASHPSSSPDTLPFCCYNLCVDRHQGNWALSRDERRPRHFTDERKHTLSEEEILHLESDGTKLLTPVCLTPKFTEESSLRNGELRLSNRKVFAKVKHTVEVQKEGKETCPCSFH